jgi:hypothetical protein
MSQNRIGGTAFVTCLHCGAPVLLQTTGRPRVHAYCEAADCRKAAAAARQRASRAGTRGQPLTPPNLDPVRSVHGTNADLIAAAARLYIHSGALVADLTYGKGVF